MSTRADLTEAEVRALGAALGFHISAEDLAEVTCRLNAFVDALVPLGDLPAGGPAATPAPVDRSGEA